MKPFLDCNIWFVRQVSYDYFLVDNIKKINSSTRKISDLDPYHIAIPEYLIKGLELLPSLDVGMINELKIPIIKREISEKEDNWYIDLKYYYACINLQSRASSHTT